MSEQENIYDLCKMFASLVYREVGEYVINNKKEYKELLENQENKTEGKNNE